MFAGLYFLKLAGVVVGIIMTSFVVGWWSWPRYARWLGPDRLSMETSALRRAVNRHNKATGESIEFLRVVRPPFLLHLLRFGSRRPAWGLVRTESGERIICLRGWFWSDSPMPEFFDGH